MTGMLEQAIAAYRQGNGAEAERLCRAALASAPNNAQANHLLGVLLLAKRNPDEAEAHLARAVRLAPNNAQAHHNHAQALGEINRLDDALAAAGRAIALDNKFAHACFTRANLLARLERLPEALRDYDEAERRGLKDPILYFAKAQTLALLRRGDDAMRAYQHAIALNPKFVEAIANRGTLLLEAGRNTEALAAFDRALAINPKSALVHNMRGRALHELKRMAEAADSYRAALALAPNYAKALYNFGFLLSESGNYEAAMNAFDNAHAEDPTLPWLPGNRLEMRLHLADWKDHDVQVADILKAVEAGRQTVSPLQLALLPASLAQQKRNAEMTVAAKCPPQPPLFSATRAPGKLRIAYLCKDFGNHATAVLVTDMLENHDRDGLEIFGISHGRDDGSPQRARLAAAFAHFHDGHGLDDRQIALRIKDLNIDIAVDLDGHTRDARPAILSHRPAPLQVAFLAYPGTMGAGHIDYLIGDDVVTPFADAPFYTEKLVNLPFSYQPNGTRVEATAIPRTGAGLPESGFVFGCFNNIFKISPRAFDSWMRILDRVPGSILWLLDSEDAVTANLRREAQARGINPSRLVFAPKIDLASHLARLRHMDLMLDTFFYGAHTTASDALWTGVPLVTLYGDAFPGRVASSLVTTLGLNQLITHSVTDYEDLAVALAADAARLADIRQILRANSGRLFNAARFARHLEDAYRQMWQRHAAGIPPESFAVKLGAFPVGG